MKLAWILPLYPPPSLAVACPMAWSVTFLGILAPSAAKTGRAPTGGSHFQAKADDGCEQNGNWAPAVCFFGGFNHTNHPPGFNMILCASFCNWAYLAAQFYYKIYSLLGLGSIQGWTLMQECDVVLATWTGSRHYALGSITFYMINFLCWKLSRISVT